MNEISLFLPRLIAAILVLLLGAAVAKLVKRVVIKILEAMMVSKLVKNTPVDHFLQNAELGQKTEDIVGSVVYWLLMLVVIHTSVTVLGLTPISAVLARVLNYIPNVISAILVLFFGLLLAGVVESVVKASIKSIDGKASRLFGKIASYMVMSVSVLVGISELGIAREFIMILFVGLVTMISLGFALALGLGAKDLVRQLLQDWYERTRAEVKE